MFGGETLDSLNRVGGLSRSLWKQGRAIPCGSHRGRGGVGEGLG